MAVSTVNHEAARAAASEKALLGALLLDARAAWPQVKDIVGRQHITRPDHGLIFGAIVDLITETGTADPVLVIDRLGAQLEAAGGRDYIADLYETCPSAANAGAYAKMMRQFADRAKVVDLAGKMQARARLGTSGSTERDLAEQITELVKGRERKPLRKLPRVNYADISLNLTARYVVKGLIRPSTLNILNGATGSGKSFFALDLACHVAAGQDWRGHRVQKGLVVYVCLEGQPQNRLLAWRKEHPEFPTNIPLVMTPGPINLRDPADIEALLDLVRESEAEHGEACVFMIVDTLSRAMAGGRENQPEDMTALIAGADMVKNITGASLLLVHHLGKDETRGGRGHSSLKGAIDTELEISRDLDARTATITKDRDAGNEGTRYAFTLNVITLGVDNEGDLVTSCIAIPTEAKPPRRKVPAGKNQDAILTAIHEWQRIHQRELILDAEVREIAKAHKVPRNRLPEVIASLERFGWIESTSNGYSILPEPS